MNKKDNEGAHGTSIAKLVEEFGQENEEEITKVYQGIRAILEKDAKIIDYVPIFAYRQVKQILRAQYEEGYLEKKVKKTRKEMK